MCNIASTCLLVQHLMCLITCGKQSSHDMHLGSAKRGMTKRREHSCFILLDWIV